MTQPLQAAASPALPDEYQRGAAAFWFAAGALMIVSGVVGLLASVPGFESLGTPLVGWPRLRFLTSLALVTLGISQLSYLRNQALLTVAGAGVSLVIGLAGLLHRAGVMSLPDDGMALASATLTTAGAMGHLTAGLGRRTGQEELSLGISGFVLVVLSGTFTLARITGVVDPMADRVVAGASIQTVVCALLLGISFLIRVWSPRLFESARWLPFAVGLAGVLTVALLWQALTAREHGQLLARTAQAADAERRTIQRELETTARSLRRTAEWRVSGASREQLERDLQLLHRDLPGLDGAVWLSPDSAGRDAITLATTEPGIDSVWREYLSHQLALTDSVAYLPLDAAVHSFLIVAPGCLGVECAGAMAGVLRSTVLFRRVSTDTTRGYRFAVFAGGVRVDGLEPETGVEQRWARSVPLRLGAVRLTLTGVPTAGTLAEARSDLPEVVLFMGLLSSGLMAATLFLGQGARRGARELERGQLAVALERATDGIWEWDLLTGQAVRSASLWRYLGYSPEEMPGTNSAWTELIHPDDQRKVRGALEDHLAGRIATFDAEYRIRSGNGDWHWMIDRGRVVERLASGAPLRILGITADITERRRSDLAREESERRFRACFDNAHQLQALLDLDGRVLEVNRSALEFGKADPVVVAGRQLWDTPLWRSTEEITSRLNTALSDARAGRAVRYETELRDATDRLVIFDFSVTPILDADGKVTQLLAEGRDISVRRRAEQILQEVESLATMGRLAARVAHEINNPLAGIQNAFLLIKGAVPKDHPHYGYVGAIEREIRRIARVTRQLYETYRPEQTDERVTSITGVVGDAVALLEQVNRDSEVRIITDLGRAPLAMPFPDTVLRQAVYNLVQNAVEASPHGGVVEVSAAVDDGAFVLRVRDEGPGIPAHIRERVFEPFFTTKSASVKTGGMGLGLALVRRSIEALGGRIAIIDKPTGGTEFIIRLPLAAHAPGGI